MDYNNTYYNELSLSQDGILFGKFEEVGSNDISKSETGAISYSLPTPAVLNRGFNVRIYLFLIIYLID